MTTYSTMVNDQFCFNFLLKDGGGGSRKHVLVLYYLNVVCYPAATVQKPLLPIDTSKKESTQYTLLLPSSTSTISPHYQTITYTTYIAVEEIGNSRERVPSSVLEKEQSCVSGVLPGMIMCSSSYVCFFFPMHPAC